MWHIWSNINQPLKVIPGTVGRSPSRPELGAANIPKTQARSESGLHRVVTVYYVDDVSVRPADETKATK